MLIFTHSLFCPVTLYTVHVIFSLISYDTHYINRPTNAHSVFVYSTIFVQLYMFRTTISFIIRSFDLLYLQLCAWYIQFHILMIPLLPFLPYGTSFLHVTVYNEIPMHFFFSGIMFRTLHSGEPEMVDVCHWIWLWIKLNFEW